MAQYALSAGVSVHTDDELMRVHYKLINFSDWQFEASPKKTVESEMNFYEGMSNVSGS